MCIISIIIRLTEIINVKRSPQTIFDVTAIRRTVFRLTQHTMKWQTRNEATEDERINDEITSKCAIKEAENRTTGRTRIL